MKNSQIGFTVILLLLAIGLYIFFESKLHPNTSNSIGQGHEILLKRDPSGHYRAEVFINGSKVDALIDTGATDVSLPGTLARQLGISSNTALRTHTANGDTVSFTTRLESVQIGGIIVKGVSAMIVPNMEGEALLGMSFLGRLDVRLFKGTMTIKPADAL